MAESTEYLLLEPHPAMKMRPMGLSLVGALDPMLRGQKIADLVTTGAAIDIVIPDIDR